MSDRPKTMLERVRDATLPAPLRGQVSDEFRAMLERIPRELEQLFDARSLAVGTEFVDNQGTTAYGSMFTSPGTRIPISATGAAAVLNAYLAHDDPTTLTTLQLLEVRRAVGDVLRPHIDLLQRGDATDPQAFSTDTPGMQLLRKGVAENAAGLVLDDVLGAVGLDRDPRLHEVRAVPQLVAARLGAHCHVMFPSFTTGPWSSVTQAAGVISMATPGFPVNQSTVHAVLASFFNGEYTSGDPRREVGERLALTRTLSALRTLIHESVHGAGQADRSAFLNDALTALPGLRVLSEGFTEAAARSMVRDIAAAVGMTRLDPRLATVSISGAYHTETAAAERLAAVVARRAGIPLHEELRMMAGAGAARLPLAVMVDQLLESAGVDPDSAIARLVAAPAIERAILAPMAELEQRLPGLTSLDAQQLAGRQAADSAIRGADLVIGLVNRTAQVNTPAVRPGEPVRVPRERPLPGVA